MSNFIYLKDLLIQKYEEGLNRLEDYKKELINSKEEKIKDFYKMKINNQLNKLIYMKSKIEYMRENNKQDQEERLNIIKNYGKQIKEEIEDGSPIVFHGVNNIGIVEEIIKSGGLFSCSERGISDRSYATDIDVTYKDNIRVSLEFADPSPTTYMPYGAIFAFKPLDSELDNVINTKESSEVFGGVSSVSFIDEPDRLYGIITTKENIKRIQNWCLKYGFDMNKVFTHDEFLKNINTILKQNTKGII